MSKLNLPQKGPATLFSNNQAAVALTKNTSGHAHTKNIDIHHHYIHERVEEGDLKVLHIAGQDNPADLMMKPLPSARHHELCDMIGIS